MRKRSRYRPKGVILDVMGWVKQGLTPVSEHGDALVRMRLRNHDAFDMLTKGRATRLHIDLLIAAVNMTEALYRMGVGREYKDEVRAGLEALREVGRRSMELGRFVLRGEEMSALSTVLELHDAQLEVITVQEMERALDIVSEEIRNKRATPIVTREVGA